MPSIEELLGISKSTPCARPAPSVETSSKTNIESNIEPNIEPSAEIISKPEPALKTSTTKLPNLAVALAAAKQKINEQTTKADETAKQQELDDSIPMQQAVKESAPNSVPTLEDISEFVFDEQSETFDTDLIDQFRIKLNSLSSATSADIPFTLSECLSFIKENAFIADILKPEHSAILVTGLRKSYGYVVQNKTVNSAKKAAANKKMDKALDAMSGLEF